MVSSSKNARAILSAAKIEHHFDVCVDGVDAERIGIPKSASHECHGWQLSSFARRSFETPCHKETRRYYFWRELLDQQGASSILC